MPPETQPRAHSPWWLGGLIVVVSLVTALAVPLTQGEDFRLFAFRSGVSPPPSSDLTSGVAAQSEFQHPHASRRERKAVREVLGGQQAALARDDRFSYVSTWSHRPDRSRQQAKATYANLTALGLRDINLRLVPGSIDALVPAVLEVVKKRALTASVRLRSSLATDSRAQRFELTYTFVSRPGRIRVRSIETAALDHEPSWLQGRLTVIRAPRIVVVGHDKSTAVTMARQLSKARRQVQAVTGAWPETLMLLLPRNIDQAERALGSGPGGIDGVAAVATTVDGSVNGNSDAMIVMNPEIWPRLSSAGVRLLLAHETAHAATGASTVTTDSWIVEGFADYVAFEAVPMPLRFSAGSALREIGRNGYPDQLPTDTDFATTQRRLVPYAQAWVVWRTIAEQHGEETLVDFYEAMIGHPQRLVTNLRSKLGTTEAQLTKQWLNELERLSTLHRSAPAPR
ncbi:MAG: hypothetical protein WKF73_04985 [Nocardioidaceae bacterium]